MNYKFYSISRCKSFYLNVYFLCAVALILYILLYVLSYIYRDTYGHEPNDSKLILGWK